MQARLTVEAGAAIPPVRDLPADQAVCLGRNRQNTIVLQDQCASRYHAEIIPDKGRWYIRDRGTLNGTRLNGQKIEGRALLRHGQEIRIGNTCLRFTVEHAKTPTAEMAADPTDDIPVLLPACPSDPGETTLQADELTALFQFMTESLNETTPHGLVGRAVATVHRHTLASVTGYLSLDAQDPQLKLVLPAAAQVDTQLSRKLTQKALREKRAVWLASALGRDLQSDSLAAFRDAICVPLRDPFPDDHDDEREFPLGALHVYRSQRAFSEREVRFCEVLAGCLASNLRVLRARRALEADNSRLRYCSSGGDDELVGDSPAMQEVRAQIAQMGDCPCTVLIQGETGVGKELVALGLHRHSSRHKAPLVTVNCANFTPSMAQSELFGHEEGAFTGATRTRPGCFQQADEGTLFLDEIGELSLECQASLLRVLETRRFRPVGADDEVSVDVRVIAATNRDLEREVREGRFRRDLFYRLGTTIKVPPLREHAEDVPDIVAHLLDQLAVTYRRRVTFSPAAIQKLQAWPWPGNVRELRMVLGTALARSKNGAVIQAADLDLRLTSEEEDSLNLEKVEARTIRQALEKTNGNNTQAAKLLGISRDTVIAKIKKYQIEIKT
jgi:DNA-binding NtrC family response regulator